MKLVFVGTSKAARGTETHLVCLVRALAEEGHDVVTVAHPDGYIARELRDTGLPVEPGIFRNAADPRGASAVLRALRKSRADWLVASFGHEYWPVLALGQSTGTRVALFRHLNVSLKPLSRWVLPRLADRFIAVSESMRSHLLSQGISSEQVQLLHNPIDLRRFRPDPQLRAQRRGELGLHPEDVVVGFVGPLTEAKGALRLAESFNGAMADDPRLRALWVGPENDHARLRALIAAPFQHRHTLCPWTNDVVAAYAPMDALAVPSEWQEPFGRVAIEAQACGVPVLASRIGGLPETLDEGQTGYLVIPGDVAAWREALVTFARIDSKTSRRMGEAGVRFVGERFGARRIAVQFEKLLG